MFINILNFNFFKTRRGAPLWCSGLRNWCYHCSGSGNICGADLIPDLGTSTCPGHGQENNKSYTHYINTNNRQLFWDNDVQLQARRRETAQPPSQTLCESIGERETAQPPSQTLCESIRSKRAIFKNK